MTVAGETTFKHEIGKPTKTGQVGVQIKYETDGGTKFKIVIAIDISKDDTALQKTAKIVAAINAKIAERDAAQRGVEAAQGVIRFPSGTEVSLAEIYITNKTGFAVKKITYNSKKTGETIKKKKIKLAYLDSGGGEGREVAMVMFQGSPSKGAVHVGVGERGLATVRTDGQSALSISESLVAQLSDAGWSASISEVSDPGEIAEDVWPHALEIASLDGDSVYVDVNDDSMGYAVSIGDEDRKAKA